MTITLREGQVTALENMRNGCILWGKTGSGKSLTSVAYYMKKEAPRDVYVLTTARKRDDLDWEEEFARYGVSRHPELTMAGVLTVDSWNNIGKYSNVYGAFFIFDEQRLVGSGHWVKAFLKIAKRNHWILLSATPGDTWMDWVPVMIANGFYRNRTEFKEHHVVYAPYVKFPKVQRYVNVARLVAIREQLLVELPDYRTTVRTTIDIPVTYDKEALERVLKARWHIYEDRPLRNAAELFAVMRRIVNSDPSRLEALKAVLEKVPRLIVFYNFNYERDILREGLKDYPEVYEYNGEKKHPLPTGERWIYLVQYDAGSEAWNCITTNATFFWSYPYSYRKWEQAHGRIDRMNTPYEELFYYVPRSKAPIDLKVWRSLSQKKNFSEARYYKQFADIGA